MRNALEAALEPDETYPSSASVKHPFGYPNIATFVRGFDPSNHRIRLARGHYHLSCCKLFQSDYKSLVVLREPVARTISELKVLIGLQGFGRDRFRQSMDRGVVPLPDNVQTRMVSGDVNAAEPDHVADRFHQLMTGPIDDPVRCLEDAIQSVVECGFFGTVENAGSLLAKVLRYLGKDEVPMPHINTANDIDLELTPSDLDLIAETNRLDSRLYVAIQAAER